MELKRWKRYNEVSKFIYLNLDRGIEIFGKSKLKRWRLVLGLKRNSEIPFSITSFFVIDFNPSEFLFVQLLSFDGTTLAVAGAISGSGNISGSAFYGEAIENMPLLEAFPDENQIMKYKLTTLPRGTSKLPVLDLGFASITLKQGASLAITPQTLNYLGATTSFEANGYTATIADTRVLSSFTGVGINTDEAERLNSTTTVGTNVSKTVIGTSINLTATAINTLFGTRTQLQTTITVVGRDSGARLTLPVTITKTN